MTLVQEKKFDPGIGKSFPLAETRAAQRFLEGREHFGKVMLTDVEFGCSPHKRVRLCPSFLGQAGDQLFSLRLIRLLGEARAGIPGPRRGNLDFRIRGNDDGDNAIVFW